MNMNKSEWNEAFLVEHNSKRNGSPFRWSSSLEALAKKHVEELVRMKMTKHGNVPPQGYQNIASGKKNMLKPHVPVNLWMTDHGHKAPITNASMKCIGAWYSHDPTTNDVIVVCNYGP
jgi:uncharacterized protein YkwD